MPREESPPRTIRLNSSQVATAERRNDKNNQKQPELRTRHGSRLVFPERSFRYCHIRAPLCLAQPQHTLLEAAWRGFWSNRCQIVVRPYQVIGTSSEDVSQSFTLEREKFKIPTKKRESIRLESRRKQPAPPALSLDSLVTQFKKVGFRSSRLKKRVPRALTAIVTLNSNRHLGKDGAGLVFRPTLSSIASMQHDRQQVRLFEAMPISARLRAPQSTLY